MYGNKLTVLPRVPICTCNKTLIVHWDHQWRTFCEVELCCCSSSSSSSRTVENASIGEVSTRCSHSVTSSTHVKFKLTAVSYMQINVSLYQLLVLLCQVRFCCVLGFYGQLILKRGVHIALHGNPSLSYRVIWNHTVLGLPAVPPDTGERAPP